jgi:hypothetical protein
MPIPCAHYALLQQRIEQLSQKFVDDQAAAEHSNPTTFQPDLDRLAAYQLLVHAELEDFLEAKAKEHLTTVTAKIAAGSAWMRQFPGLIALAIAVAKPTPLISIVDTQAFLTYVSEVLSAARKAIAENNGIKSQSFVRLSICAGKTIDEIDDFLLGSLNSYGTGRGDVAHKSVTHSTSLQAPSAELASVRSMVQQLASYFDVCP